MSKRVEYEIVVVDRGTKRWPPLRTLIEAGVLIAVVRRYQVVRRQMTSGLRKRVKKDVN